MVSRHVPTRCLGIRLLDQKASSEGPVRKVWGGGRTVPFEVADESRLAMFTGTPIQSCFVHVAFEHSHQFLREGKKRHRIYTRSTNSLLLSQKTINFIHTRDFGSPIPITLVPHSISSDRVGCIVASHNLNRTGELPDQRKSSGNPMVPSIKKKDSAHFFRQLQLKPAPALA